MSGWTEQDIFNLRKANTSSLPVKATAARAAPTGRIPKPEMNSVETAYNAHLDMLQSQGLVIWHRFEAATIKLGPDCRLTPDQLIMLPSGELQFHDTKGTKKIKVGKRAGGSTYYAEEDAVVKARVLAGNFVIPIYFVWKERNGEWGKKLIGDM